MAKKRFRGLFFNAVLALSLISLVPFVLVGIYFTRANSRILQHEIFQKQQTIASQLSAVVHTYFTRASEYFSVFIDLHTEFGGHSFLNQEDLDYLRQRDNSISYLALLNTSGEQLLSQGELLNPAGYKGFIPGILKSCVQARENYIGQVYFIPQRGWFLLMAFPVYESLAEKRTSGILLVEMDLRKLTQLLAKVYPLEMDAFLVNAQNEIFSHNGFPQNSSDLQVAQSQIQAVRQQLADRMTGEVTLPDGRKWLVSSVDLFLPGWRVYVAQPGNMVHKLLFGDTSHLIWGGLRLFLLMLLFVFVVSHWVIVPITHPLERLRKAALRLREGDDIIRREDVEIPHNEIGDLSEVFLEMAAGLHNRREELLLAQRQLSNSNRELEHRVQERTQELQTAMEELVKKERLATMGQMASIISHEIRNPLAVISNATRLIKMLVKPHDIKVDKQIGIIEDEIKQANSIISEVLGYARSRDLILSAIELNSYLHDILLSYPLPPGIRLEEKLEANPVRVKIDAEEMKQAIRNLITNAVEAMQNQGTLTIGVKTGEHAVCIYVADTGVGVPENIRRKIFAPFFTTKARGTGLGLAVVGKAVSRHQGKLFIRSEEGKGSCFEIYLKIYQKPGDTYYGQGS